MNNCMASPEIALYAFSGLVTMIKNRHVTDSLIPFLHCEDLSVYQNHQILLGLLNRKNIEKTSNTPNIN